ncbi:hypothetical protein PAAG_06047 [Paracoccidioides lutzii Pb01]|uniref:Major facilitator superfamily (MFS) profile domain-containing protein n=1 Tax=Paracoccidioides lutzii (strain ATCC MYA-826 / Pb01) TaxID=502779 RepID=C1H5K6_PARBA|nr:hypothetical protein PAAG_06047 [Paracoccidioides lutzii Pb01]EEH35000.2 hypothetical protein PAAG_06047 [Paracoccidioides lutzii Pb01]
MEKLPSGTNPSTDLECGPGTSFVNNRESSLSSGHGDDNDDLRIEQISSTVSQTETAAVSVHKEETLNRAHSDIPWMGSVQNFLLFFIGTFSGRATDAGYFKAVWTADALILTTGIFMTSLTKTYWQLLLSQGLCMVALISTYFSSKRAIVLAIGVTGSATGGLVSPGIIRTLLPRIGYAWAVRVFGFLTLAFLRQRVLHRKGGPFIEWAAFKEIQFSLFAVAMFLNFWGIYIAFFYISSYGRNVIGLSKEKSIDLLLIVNGVGIAGRLLPNFISDDISSLYALAILNGYFASGLQSLFLATLSSMSPDLKKTGIRFGMILSIASFASFTGPPISGALIHLKNGKYLYAQIFSGTSMAMVAMVLICARISVTGLVMKVKI